MQTDGKISYTAENMLKTLDSYLIFVIRTLYVKLKNSCKSLTIDKKKNTENSLTYFQKDTK